jgi:hypothetical protein
VLLLLKCLSAQLSAPLICRCCGSLPHERLVHINMDMRTARHLALAFLDSTPQRLSTASAALSTYSALYQKVDHALQCVFPATLVTAAPWQDTSAIMVDWHTMRHLLHCIKS